MAEEKTFTCKLGDPVDGSPPCQGDCGPWCSGFRCSYCEYDCKQESDKPNCIPEEEFASDYKVEGSTPESPAMNLGSAVILGIPMSGGMPGIPKPPEVGKEMQETLADVAICRLINRLEEVSMEFTSMARVFKLNELEFIGIARRVGTDAKEIMDKYGKAPEVLIYMSFVSFYLMQALLQHFRKGNVKKEEEMGEPNHDKCMCDWSLGMGPDLNCPVHGVIAKEVEEDARNS